MKPLYITPEKKTRVALDGPSLLVEAEGQAAARFPLRLVSEVVSAGPVEWTQSALVACLERKAPLTFLTGRGEAAGTALPAGDPLSWDAFRLEEMLASPDLVRRYEDWVRSEERRGLLRALKVLGMETRDLRREAAKRALERRLESVANAADAKEVCRWMAAALRSRVAAAAARQSWCAELLAGRREGFHFLRDAERALGWTIYTDAERLLRASRGQKPAPDGWKQAALAESARLAARDERRIEEYLNRFRFRMGGRR